MGLKTIKIFKLKRKHYFLSGSDHLWLYVMYVCSFVFAVKLCFDRDYQSTRKYTRNWKFSAAVIRFKIHLLQTPMAISPLPGHTVLLIS